MNMTQNNKNLLALILLICISFAQSVCAQLVPPTVTTGGAMGILTSEATLLGTVNPNGLATTARFEYGTTALDSTANVTLSPSNGSLHQAINSTIVGLLAGTQYYYRIVAVNSAGESTGEIKSFVTKPTMPFLFTTYNNEITITRYVGSDNVVSVPQTINGVPVKIIGHAAFANTAVTSVTLPESIVTIAGQAFQGCTSLANFTIPNNVASIGYVAFQRCSKLTTINIPASVTSIDDGPFATCGALLSISVDPQNPNYSSLDGILYDKTQQSLIQYPAGITGGYTMPSSVTNIRDLAFSSSKLSSITIGSSISSIGSSTFSFCSNLASVVIPANVTNIYGTSFSGCFALTSISVEATNPAYSSVNGVLFDKNQTTLVSYPAGLTGSYTIPTGVITIGANAFGKCSNLTGITIPSSVSIIGEWSFASCSGLSEVNFPSSITAIGSGAFSYCTGVTGFNIPTCTTTIGVSVTQGSGYSPWPAFPGCTNLVSIAVDATNPVYSSRNGVLFNKAQTILLTFPGGKIGSYDVPSGVTTIGTAAFTYINKLTSITIPESVSTIESNAFDACEGLLIATFLGDAPSMPSNFFRVSPNFKVYFLSGKAGFTLPQWKGYPSFALTVSPRAVWTNGTGGFWSIASNWMDHLIGDGSDKTCDFTTLDLAADLTVTLDGARTIGNLKFGDMNPSHNWTLASGSGEALTLQAENGAPFIEVVNQNVTMSVDLAGFQNWTKSGDGTLTLTGNNTHTGLITVEVGTLAVNNPGSIGPASSVTVKSGATLGGDGTIGGAVTVTTGGTLAPALADIGKLTINNALTLNAGSTTTMQISKSGATLASDSIAGLTGVSYGGTLYVTLVGDTPTDGDKFTLFVKSSGSYSGAFANLTLPPLPTGMMWDTSGLMVDGSIKARYINVAEAPAIDPPSGYYATDVAVSITGNNAGATIHYTMDGSDPVSSPTKLSGPSPVTGLLVPAHMPKVIKAYCAVPGFSNSPVTTAEYNSNWAIWINSVGGSWPIAGNWFSGSAETGANVMADFSTLNLDGDATVTLDGVRTIGRLKFGDSTPSHNWFLNTGSGGSLTMLTSTGTPGIEVVNQTVNISTVLTGNQGFEKTGSGTLTLAEANTYSGSTVLAAGTLNLNNATALGATAGALTISGPSTLDNTSAAAITLSNNNPQNWNADWTFTGTQSLNLGSGAVSLNGTRQVTVSNKTLTVNGIISGAGCGLTKAGSGSLVIGRNSGNTLSGPVTVTRGVLTLGSLTGSGTVSFNTPSLLKVQNAAGLDLPLLHAYTMQTATWTLAPITLESGATLRFRAQTGSNTHNLAAAISCNGFATFENYGGSYAQNINLSGKLSGSGTINYLATSDSYWDVTTRTLTLSNASTDYSGTWRVDYVGSTSDDFVALSSTAAGALGTGLVELDDRARLVAGTVNSLNSLTGVTLQKATSFVDVNSSTTIQALNGTVGTVAIGSGTSTVELTVNSGSFNGVIQNGTGTLALTKATTGTLVLTGTNTYSGATIISAGTLKLGSASNALGATTSGTTVNSGAVLDLDRSRGGSEALTINGTGINGGGALINGLAWSGPITIASDSSVGGTTSTTLSGIISGPGSLTKVGSGTLTLTKPNTYTGPTTIIAGGKLLVTNTSGSATGTSTVTVKSTGTLGGTGAVSGAVTVESGGSLAPGTTSIGMLAAGALTLSAGSTYAVQIRSSSTPAADVTHVTGDITLAGTMTLTDLASPQVALSVATKLTILTYTGTLAGTFTGYPEGSTITVGPNTYFIRYHDGQAVTLEVMVTHASWLAGYFPGNTDTAIIGATADPDHDGLPNAVEMVLGGNPANTQDTAMLPEVKRLNVDLGAGAIDYFLFSYRRTAASVTAGVTAIAQSNPTLGGTWSDASNDILGVKIQEDPSFHGPGTDRVRVYIPRDDNPILFGRLRVVTP